jgi:hypothetical protein
LQSVEVVGQIASEGVHTCLVQEEQMAPIVDKLVTGHTFVDSMVVRDEMEYLMT